MKNTSPFLWFLFLTTQCIFVCIAMDSTDSQTVRSIWIIRHADIAETQWSDTPLEANSRLSIYGKKQASEIARFLGHAIIGHATDSTDEESLPYTPWIFTSPFKRCVQTALAIAKFFDTKIKVEHGLAKQLTGSWGIPKNLTQLPNVLQRFDDDYESKFELPEELINFKEFQFTREFSDWWHQKYVFDKKIANYFLKLFHEEVCGDIIIITHQTEVYNIGKAIRNAKMSVLEGEDKSRIRFGTYQQYVPNRKRKLIFHAQGTIKAPETTTRKPMSFLDSPRSPPRPRKRFSYLDSNYVGSPGGIHRHTCSDATALTRLSLQDMSFPIFKSTESKNNISQPSGGTTDKQKFPKIVTLKTNASIVSPPRSRVTSKGNL